MADQWETYLNEKRAAQGQLAGHLQEAEKELNDRVFRLFNLTREEIKLLQREVAH